MASNYPISDEETENHDDDGKIAEKFKGLCLDPSKHGEALGIDTNIPLHSPCTEKKVPVMHEMPKGVRISRRESEEMLKRYIGKMLLRIFSLWNETHRSRFKISELTRNDLEIWGLEEFSKETPHQVFLIKNSRNQVTHVELYFKDPSLFLTSIRNFTEK